MIDEPNSNIIGKKTAQTIRELIREADANQTSSPTSGTNVGGISVSKTPFGHIIDQDSFRMTDEKVMVVLVDRDIDGGDDYTDNRYFAREVLMVADDEGENVQTKPYIYGDGSWMTVHNLGEASQSCHTLPVANLDDLGATDDKTSVELDDTYTLCWARKIYATGKGEVDGRPIYVIDIHLPATFPARITIVSGSFPEFAYTAQRVKGFNSANTGFERWEVYDESLGGLKNRCEWTPVSYPYTHGNGIRVINSAGEVALDFNSANGNDTSSCKIRAIGLGSVVDVSVCLDQNGDITYSFYAPNSAQPD